MEKPDIVICNLGYSDIGEHPEGKDAPDAYVAGDIGVREPEERPKDIRIARLLRQQDAGVDWVPVGDFAPCDRVLEHGIAFGLVPERLAVSAVRVVAADSGAPEAEAVRTKSWYGTACTYTALEPGPDAQPRLVYNPWAEAFREARPRLRALPVPVMIGPYTFAKLMEGPAPEAALERLAPVYAEALRGLGEAGAEWVQLEEPELARPVPPEHWPLIERSYQAMHDAAPELHMMLQLTYGVPDEWTRLLALPAAGIGFDFTADGGRALQAVAKHGFPADRVLGAGIVDGRRVWRSDLTAALALLENLRRLVPHVRRARQPSCSLRHAPAAPPDGRAPHGLPRHALASADVKLGELRVLRTALTEGRDAVRLDLTDSDVLQDMLRVLLPAVWPDGGAKTDPARTQAATSASGPARAVRAAAGAAPGTA